MYQVIKPTLELGCSTCLKTLLGFSHTDKLGFAPKCWGAQGEAFPGMYARLPVM